MIKKALIALLAALAAAMVIVHLRMPHNTRSWRMDESRAAARAGERMNVSMPEGDVDVNNGSVEELDRLYGVGPALAQAIVEEREANGLFHYPEDLINVKGIGEKTLQKMRDQLLLP